MHKPQDRELVGTDSANTVRPATLEEMVGQMLLVGFQGTSVNDSSLIIKEIKNGIVGGVVLYEKNIDKVQPIQNLKALIAELQRNAEIPLFVSIDHEGGKVNRLKTKYGFPPTLTATYLGNLNNTDSTRAYAASSAETLKMLGFNVNFAPVVDLCANPDNPVIGRYQRCYSESAEVVSNIALIVMQEHYARGVLPVLKHFPGHGSSNRDTHIDIADVTNTWTSEELEPYEYLTDFMWAKAVMTAHIVNGKLDKQKLPATLSKSINTDLLRDSLGFAGLLFSDDMQMRAIEDHFQLKESIKLAINSGVDVLMYSYNNVGGRQSTYTVEEIHGVIMNLLKRGEVSEERIRESYERIMAVKQYWPGEGVELSSEFDSVLD